MLPNYDIMKFEEMNIHESNYFTVLPGCTRVLIHSHITKSRQSGGKDTDYN